MNITEEIKGKRPAVAIHCGYLNRGATLVEIMEIFSLTGKPDELREIDKKEAVEILTCLLHKDMAYGSKIMPESEASAMARCFLAEFEVPGARFLTNINYAGEGKKIAPNCWAGADWMPMTPSTFDAGVIARSSTKSACLWVEDED